MNTAHLAGWQADKALFENFAPFCNVFLGDFAITPMRLRDFGGVGRSLVDLGVYNDLLIFIYGVVSKQLFITTGFW